MEVGNWCRIFGWDLPGFSRLFWSRRRKSIVCGALNKMANATVLISSANVSAITSQSHREKESGRVC